MLPVELNVRSSFLRWRCSNRVEVGPYYSTHHTQSKMKPRAVFSTSVSSSPSQKANSPVATVHASFDNSQRETQIETSAFYFILYLHLNLSHGLSWNVIISLSEKSERKWNKESIINASGQTQVFSINQSINRGYWLAPQCWKCSRHSANTPCWSVHWFIMLISAHQPWAFCVKKHTHFKRRCEQLLVTDSFTCFQPTVLPHCLDFYRI